MKKHRFERSWPVLALLVMVALLAGTLWAGTAQAFRFVFLADSRAEDPHHVQHTVHQPQKHQGDSHRRHDSGHQQDSRHQHVKAAPAPHHCSHNAYINEEAIKDLTNQIKKHHPDLVIFGGDMAWRGGKKNLEDWKCLMQEGLGHIKLYVAIGNHELYGQKGQSEAALRKEYQEVFRNMAGGNHPPGYDKLAYSFRHGDSVFVVLDAYHHSAHKAEISKNQREWVERQLHGAKYKFIISHAPAHSLHAADVDTHSMRELWQMLEKYHATLFFAGHEHLYHRSKPGHLTQVIAGNAGATKHHPYNFVVVDVHHDGVKATAYGGHQGNYRVIDGPFKP